MFNSVFLVRASQNGSQQGAADSVSGTVLCLSKNSISNSFIRRCEHDEGRFIIRESMLHKKLFDIPLNIVRAC